MRAQKIALATYILLLKKASRDICGAVSGYISGHVTSRMKALVSSSSPICNIILKWKLKQMTLAEIVHVHQNLTK